MIATAATTIGGIGVGEYSVRLVRHNSVQDWVYGVDASKVVTGKLLGGTLPCNQATQPFAARRLRHPRRSSLPMNSLASTRAPAGQKPEPGPPLRDPLQRCTPPVNG